jgi:predicted TPR repeat methyltransferase
MCAADTLSGLWRRPPPRTPSEGRDFELKPTRRYAHSGAYLRQVAQDQGFVAETIESKVTREEDGKELMGYLAVLRASSRPSAPEKNNVRKFEAARR